LDDGTAIGDAIGTAVNRLHGAPSPSQVLNLLTDGQNNRGIVDPVTAARAALTYHVKIYTIGVGTRGMARVPVGIGPQGKEQFAMQKVLVDDTLLTQVATFTGGRYFRATNAAALRAIYHQIDTLEKTKNTTKVPVHYADLFQWTLGGAVLLLLLELIIAAVRGPLP
jgi:Ca-activated chloride channel family protein